MQKFFAKKHAPVQYCPDSGDLNKEEIAEYWRYQFLKDIERDLNEMNLITDW